MKINKVIYTQEREYIKPLDKIPRPAYELFDDKIYPRKQKAKKMRRNYLIQHPLILINVIY